MFYLFALTARIVHRKCNFNYFRKMNESTLLVNLPSDVIAEIFSFFQIQSSRWKMFRWQFRNPLRTWFRLMLVCKTFLRIGRRVFDPSIKAGMAFRIACTRGYFIDPRL